MTQQCAQGRRRRRVPLSFLLLLALPVYSSGGNLRRLSTVTDLGNSTTTATISSSSNNSSSATAITVDLDVGDYGQGTASVSTIEADGNMTETELSMMTTTPQQTTAPQQQPQQYYDPSLLQPLHIAGLYDIRSFPDWPLHLMKFTARLLNNHSDGWHDDVLPYGPAIEVVMKDSACDPDVAVRKYLEVMRKDDVDTIPHAIYGCRCSGASMAVGRLAAVENIPMLSPYSTSTKLSNKEEYPTFSRLAAPDDDRGQVGALIQLLRSFGWDRISVINTDTQFTKDIALELSDAWKGRHVGGEDDFVGEIAYTDTIKLNKTADGIDQESVRRVLKAVPVENPAVNSRIIVLFAHHQHAYPILKVAAQMNFQPDTIWVGTSEWIGRKPKDLDTSWMPPVPGYIGLEPYRNRTSPQYVDFLQRLQAYEQENHLPVTPDLYDFAADRVIDGTLALTKALYAVPPDLRRNGLMVSQQLRNLKFDGIIGPVAFDENGDLKDPRFTVVTLKTNGTEWTPVGFVTPNHFNIDRSRVCFANVGCVATIPDDEYPAEKDLLPIWIWIVIACLVLISALFYHQRLKNQSVTEKLRRIEEELKTLDSNDDAVKLKKGRLYKEIADLLGQPTPEHWTKRRGLVNVAPTQQEYWDVLEKLQATMNDGETCHLSKLMRIQNVGIWSYYVFRKNQLANKYGTDLNDTDKLKEVSVWHGTSSLNPDVIYNDQQDGFMMQLSQQGQWGRGIYFSERSGYSDPYSFKPLTEYSDGFQQDRELFLVKLLVGESIFLDRNEGDWMQEACKTLVTPPDNPNRNGFKFDTVEGLIDDEKKTRVFVVYENGRAYPEYLVRYYKGDRDERRTPFCSLEEALVDKALKEKEEAQDAKESAKSGSITHLVDDDDDDDDENDGMRSSVSSHSSNHVSVQAAAWQFENDKGVWENYLDGHQIQLEQAYQRDMTGVTTIEHFPWTYCIDFNVNIQTNLDHPDKTTRKIRRIYLDDDDEDNDGRGSDDGLEERSRDSGNNDGLEEGYRGSGIEGNAAGDIGGSLDNDGPVDRGSGGGDLADSRGLVSQ